MATGSQAKSPMSTVEGGQASGCPAGHEGQKPRPRLPGPSPACAALAAVGEAPWGMRGSVSAALLLGLPVSFTQPCKLSMHSAGYT